MPHSKGVIGENLRKGLLRKERGELQEAERMEKRARASNSRKLLPSLTDLA